MSAPGSTLLAARAARLATVTASLPPGKSSRAERSRPQAKRNSAPAGGAGESAPIEPIHDVRAEGEALPLPEQSESLLSAAGAGSPLAVDDAPLPLADDNGFGVGALPAGPRLTSGCAGDHAAVHHLLATVFQNPSYDDFLATLDDPFYEPQDRLLVKSGHRILAHAYVARRVIRFGALELPVSVLHWVATLPECRGLGYARRLLEVADRAMTEDGSSLGLLQTKIPYFFRPHGWAVCGRHCLSRAHTREVLAQVSQRWQQNPLRPEPALRIRPWRQVELPALMRVYQSGAERDYGAIARTEAYWRWLISRKAFDQIYVAVLGPDRFELEDDASIVGYVITRQDQVVELRTERRCPGAAVQLLARACGEAIERDVHAITYCAPPNDPLHELLCQAGGARLHHESHQGDVFMVKLLDPWAFLQQVVPLVRARVEAARLVRPIDLGLSVDGQKGQVLVTRRSVRIQRGKLGRRWLALNRSELTRLVLGHADPAEAACQGRIEASSRAALELARVLFPPLPLWRSPLDELDS